MRATYRFALIATLLAILAVSTLVSYGQLDELTGRKYSMYSLKVNKANLTVYIYPDATVSCSYSLDALLKPETPGVDLTGFNLTLYSIEKAKKQKVEGRTSLTLYIPTFTPVTTMQKKSVSKLKLKLELVERSRLDRGYKTNGSFKLWIESRGKTGVFQGTYSLTLTTSKAVLEAIVDIKGKNVTQAKKFCEAFTKGFEEAKEELSWVKLVECKVEKNKLRFKMVIDMAALFERLISLGIPQSDVNAVKKILSKSYGISSETKRVLTFSTESSLFLKYEALSRSEGKISEYLLDVAKASESIARVYMGVNMMLQRLLLRYATETVKTKIPVIPPTMVTTALLARVPPYKSETSIVVIGGKDGLSIKVEYSSPKMVYAYASKDRLVRVYQTLKELSKSFVRLSQTLAILEAFAEGISKILPREAYIVGIDEVKVKPNKVDISKLDSVEVELPAKSSTTKPSVTTEHTPKPSQASAAPSATTTKTTQTPGKGGLDTTTIIAASVGAVIAVIVVALLLLKRGGA